MRHSTKYRRSRRFTLPRGFNKGQRPLCLLGIARWRPDHEKTKQNKKQKKIKKKQKFKNKTKKKQKKNTKKNGEQDAGLL